MRGTVVVIGGGVTGLVAARRVSELLGPGSVTLIESAPRLGGKILTVTDRGMTIEGGPDCFLASKPAGLALCEDLGLTGQLIETNAALRRSFVKRRARLHPLPDGISGLVPSRLMPLMTTGVLSVRGRLRAALEPLVPRSHSEADESIGAFVRRRFGAEAWTWLVEPLLSGIYAGNGEALSLRSTFPQLRETERRQGSVLKPLVFGRGFDTSPASARRGFVSLSGGMQQLTDTLAATLEPARIMLGTAVTAVRQGGDAFEVSLADGSVVSAPVVVQTAPAFEAAGMFDALDAELAAALREIPFVSSATIAVAFRRGDVPAVLSGFGYVSPRAEGGDIVACTWTSNKFPSRAPSDIVMLRCFVGRAGTDAVVSAPDSTLVSLVRDELQRVHGIVAEPVMARVARWPRGLPQYTLGHDERVARIAERLAANTGLFVAGASYHGVGIPDCIASARAAAEAAAAYARAT